METLIRSHVTPLILLAAAAVAGIISSEFCAHHVSVRGGPPRSCASCPPVLYWLILCETCCKAIRRSHATQGRTNRGEPERSKPFAAAAQGDCHRTPPSSQGHARCRPCASRLHARCLRILIVFSSCFHRAFIVFRGGNLCHATAAAPSLCLLSTAGGWLLFRRSRIFPQLKGYRAVCARRAIAVRISEVLLVMMPSTPISSSSFARAGSLMV